MRLRSSKESNKERKTSDGEVVGQTSNPKLISELLNWVSQRENLPREKLFGHTSAVAPLPLTKESLLVVFYYNNYRYLQSDAVIMFGMERRFDHQIFIHSYLLNSRFPLLSKSTGTAHAKKTAA